MPAAAQMPRTRLRRVLIGAGGLAIVLGVAGLALTAIDIAGGKNWLSEGIAALVVFAVGLIARLVAGRVLVDAEAADYAELAKRGQNDNLPFGARYVQAADGTTSIVLRPAVWIQGFLGLMIVGFIVLLVWAASGADSNSLFASAILGALLVGMLGWVWRLVLGGRVEIRGTQVTRLRPAQTVDLRQATGFTPSSRGRRVIITAPGAAHYASGKTTDTMDLVSVFLEISNPDLLDLLTALSRSHQANQP